MEKIQEGYHRYRFLPADGNDITDIAEDDDKAEAYIKLGRTIKDLAQEIASCKSIEALKERYTNIDWKRFQKEIIKCVLVLLELLIVERNTRLKRIAYVFVYLLTKRLKGNVFISNTIFFFIIIILIIVLDFKLVTL